MRSSVLLVLLLVATPALAQHESGAALGSPRAPAAPPAAPPADAAPTATPDDAAPAATPDDAATPADAATPPDAAPIPTPPPGSLGDVPPPPPTGYDPAVRYPVPAPTTGPGFDTGSDSSGPSIPSRLATRLRVLDSSLQALGARGGAVVDGVLSIVGGAVVAGLGGWQLDESRSLASYLLLWGSVNIVRGVVTLAVTPNAARQRTEFANMPLRTMDDVSARLAFGERALESIARRAKAVRVFDASLNMAVGLAFIPIYLAPNDFKIVDPFDYFILIGSGISALSGLISLLTRSDAERRWEAYRELRDRLVREGGEDVAQIEPPEGFRIRGAGVAPVRAGAALTIDATF